MQRAHRITFMFCSLIIHSFFFLMSRRLPRSTLFPYTTLFRSLINRRSLLLALRLLWKTPIFHELNPLRSEERFSRNAETDLVCRLLLEKKKKKKEKSKKTIKNKHQKDVNNYEAPPDMTTYESS